MSLHVLPYGPGAVLVEAGTWEPATLAARLRGLDGVVDAVPGAATVLVTFDLPSMSEEEAVGYVSELICDLGESPVSRSASAPREVCFPVTYDGEDLAHVAARTRMSESEVIERHAAASYRVVFMGFAPGFGYLEGLDPVLRLPRLDTPRAAVPAGAVAIAGAYSAVYPRSSPGGWLLLGHTDVTLFDVDAEPPALLAPGTLVRFEPA